METIISSYCKIKNNTVWVNGSVVVSDGNGEDLPAFLASVYKKFDINYPKFYKMDKLCKLGLLAAELVIRNSPDLSALPKEEIAMVFANNASSLDSDRNHINAIADKQNYFPSPAVFVYTLPNIVIGEIAIKHKITGENAFFVSQKFDENLMHEYSGILLQNKLASAVLCGWVNVDGNNAEAFVYCVKNLNFRQENSGFQERNNPQVIQRLYTF